MARQMLSLFNAHGKELASDTDWTILDRVNVFPTVVDQAEYDLPGDFDHLVINTVWDRSQLTPVRGPISPAMWQTIKSGLIGNGIYFRRYRIVRGVNMAVRKFVIDPTPGTSGADLVFEYISNAWVSLNDGSSICTRVTNDTDFPLLDATLMRLGLKWRFLRAKGLPFTTELNEHNEMLDKISGRDRPEPGASLVGPGLVQRFLGYLNIPETGYGN
ncbi:MAG: hypothetical protein BGO51_06175 [Rhodospirillales bacterium 69-11]|nr:MAG: hypothetical protein BGO51_06175 [Rhodospirillales bacterium 69-11]